MSKGLDLWELAVEGSVEDWSAGAEIVKTALEAHWIWAYSQHPGSGHLSVHDYREVPHAFLLLFFFIDFFFINSNKDKTFKYDDR